LFSLKDLFKRETFNIFTYPGSLTVSSCNPVVTWMVSTGRTPILASELEGFRKLKDDHDGSFITNPSRPVQLLNGRSYIVVGISTSFVRGRCVFEVIFFKNETEVVLVN
jgi:carbonic anhydrase